jgi:hypothetical protein
MIRKTFEFLLMTVCFTVFVYLTIGQFFLATMAPCTLAKYSIYGVPGRCADNASALGT